MINSHQSPETATNLRPSLHTESENNRSAIIELARKQNAIEGVLEIDDNALLSEGHDNGCYVQAWVWTDFTGTTFDKDKPTTNLHEN
jgi:hypothetical protein